MVICIAIGNLLRGDDGVAHRALQLIAPSEHVQLREVFQLTPELASDIANAEAVIFLDADPASVAATLQEMEALPVARSPLAHKISPAEVLELARRLYGFAGQAFLCRIPAADFGHGQKLSAQAEAGAHAAARMIQQKLSEM